MKMERDGNADLEKVLAAMGAAEAPDGIEARIAERLRWHAACAPLETTRSSSAVRSAWWRGALSGAAAALFVTAAVLFIGHRLQAPVANPGASSFSAAPRAGVAVRSVPADPAPLPVAVSTAEPCSGPTVRHNARVTPEPVRESFRLAGLRPATLERSYPASEPPLTAEERQLVRLARRGYPPQDLTVDPALLAHVEAQDTADFQRFFSQAPQGDNTWNKIVVAQGDGI